MKVMAHGLKGGTSFMEDYTYHFDPAGPAVLGAHMLEICPSIAKGKPSCEMHPLGIGGKEDPVRLVFDSPDRRRRQRLDRRHGQPLPHDRQHGESRCRRTSSCRSCPSPACCGEPEPSLAVGAAAWIYAGGAHHTGFSLALTPEHLEDFADMAGIEYLLIDNETRLREFKNEFRWNEAAYKIGHSLR